MRRSNRVLLSAGSQLTDSAVLRVHDTINLVGTFGSQTEGALAMPRRSLLFRMTTVALLVGLRLSPALAAQYNSAPPHQNAGGKPSSPLSNNAYTVSTALSTALSVGGTANAGSVNANLANQSNAVLSGK